MTYWEIGSVCHLPAPQTLSIKSLHMTENDNISLQDEKSKSFKTIIKLTELRKSPCQGKKNVPHSKIILDGYTRFFKNKLFFKKFYLSPRTQLERLFLLSHSVASYNWAFRSITKIPLQVYLNTFTFPSLITTRLQFVHI